MAPLFLDFEANTYIAVEVSSYSPCLSNPELLSTAHSALSYVGPVGSLQDVLLVSVPRLEWKDRITEILAALRSAPGVLRVEVQRAMQRTKRRGEP